LIALLLIASAGVLAFVASKTPFFFANLAAGGFARLDKTYGAGPGEAEVADAVGVAVDGAGNISAVTYSGRVFRFSPDGTALSGWSLEGNDLPVRTIKADNAGNLYIVVGGAIHKQDGPKGFQIKVITVDDPLGLNDLATAPDGSLLSYLGGTPDQLVRFDPNGTEVAHYHNPLSEITGDTGVLPWLVCLATGSDGTIYLLNLDSKYSPVFVYTSEGKYHTRFGVYGDAEGQLHYPKAIALDSKNRVYIGDSGGVKVFSADGTYAGIIRVPFSGVITGMAFDRSDHLYVVSPSEKKVYRFALNEPQ
jgi:WD40 repeat protein